MPYNASALWYFNPAPIDEVVIKKIRFKRKKVKNGIVPHFIKDMFTIKETPYDLRNSNFVILKF